MNEWVLVLGLSSMQGFEPGIPVPPIIIPMQTKEACLNAVSTKFIRPMYAKLCINTQTGEVLQK